MCLKQSDKCTTYSGPSFQNIGIEQNMDLSDFNAQMGSVVSALKTKIDACACAGSSGGSSMDSQILLSKERYTGYTTTSCAATVTYRSFKYTTVGSINPSFTYDANTFATSLPQGVVLESIRVRITKDNKIIANLSGVSSGIQLTMGEVPAIAIIEVRLNSSCGNILLSKTIYIGNSGETNVTTSLDLNDSGNQYNLRTVDEFLSMIYDRVLKIESGMDIASLKTSIQNLQEEVNNLKAQIS